MKYILLLFIVFGFWACQDDDDGTFRITMSKENVHFKATPGGAVMYYYLPSDGDVFSLNLRYTDARGQEVLKVGGYGGDSLIIEGFNEARKGVPAQVTLVNRRNEESSAIEVSFDTENSAPYAFFESAEVSPYWEGFQVTYEAPDQVAGMAHVFYLGTNPLTHNPDTILVKSFPILRGRDTMRFRLQQLREKNTIILRTEDYRGYRVKQKIWEDVEAYGLEKLNLSEANFIDKYNLSQEIERDKLGAKYLFDGDLKGKQRMLGGDRFSVYTFLAGPNAREVPFIFDMNQAEVPACVRIYGMLKFDVPFPDNTYPKNDHLSSEIWMGTYKDKLPCYVTLYGGNDKDGDDWKELGSFYQNRLTLEEDRWSVRCSHKNYLYRNEEELATAEPAYIEIMFTASKLEKYRYLKLIVNDVFVYDYYVAYGIITDNYNQAKYVTMHEFEIYVKKD